MTKFSTGMQRVLSTSKHLTVQCIISYLDYIYHKYWDTLDYIYHKYWDTLNSFLDIWFNYCNGTTYITQEAAKQHSWGQKNRHIRLKPTIILKEEWSYEHPTIKFLPLYILDPRRVFFWKLSCSTCRELLCSICTASIIKIEPRHEISNNMAF